MQIEMTVLLTLACGLIAALVGILATRRTNKIDTKNEASQMTTVIVKLENISTGITEIKSELSNVKLDVKEDHERIVKVEESAKQSHKRLDMHDKLLYPENIRSYEERE